MQYQIMKAACLLHPAEEPVLLPDVRTETQVQTLESTEKCSVLRIERSWQNTGSDKAVFLPCIFVESMLPVEHYMIPCVVYSGNEYGNGVEPKGLSFEGKPWYFASERIGIPGCSAVMGKDGCSALFCSKTENTSCSLAVEKGRAVHKLCFSHIEYPKTYIGTFDYREEEMTYLTLMPGESFHATAYLYHSGEAGAYGYRGLFDWLLCHLPDARAARSVDEVYSLSFSFLRRLAEQRGEDTLTNMGLLPGGEHRLGTEQDTFCYRKFGRYEAGWAGQNLSHAWLFLYDSIRAASKAEGHGIPAPFDVSFMLRGNFDTESESYRLGIGILDTWQRYRYPNGLVPVMLDLVLEGHYSGTLDTCNLGWIAWQYTNSYLLLKNNGILREDYRQTAKELLDFFADRYDPEVCFPQQLNEKGEVLKAEGMAGTYLTMAMLFYHLVTGEEKYFAIGKASFDFYYDRYLVNNVAAGGALDTCCVDKESAIAVLRAALMLERITGDSAYLKKAEKIACYLQTWMFFYDVVFPQGSDAEKMGLKTMGSTSVSVQHHHLDCFAALYVPDYLYLADKTGNPLWKKAAEHLYAFSVSFISDGTQKLHGMIRPAGGQNEGVFHCNWGGAAEPPGTMNDWLVSWVKTFQLLNVAYFETAEKITDGRNLV